jgi:hypothetical protein
LLLPGLKFCTTNPAGRGKESMEAGREKGEREKREREREKREREREN